MWGMTVSSNDKEYNLCSVRVGWLLHHRHNCFELTGTVVLFTVLTCSFIENEKNELIANVKNEKVIQLKPRKMKILNYYQKYLVNDRNSPPIINVRCNNNCET